MIIINDSLQPTYPSKTAHLFHLRNAVNHSNVPEYSLRMLA
jgi:hypothetical protein